MEIVLGQKIRHIILKHLLMWSATSQASEPYRNKDLTLALKILSFALSSRKTHKLKK